MLLCLREIASPSLSPAVVFLGHVCKRGTHLAGLRKRLFQSIDEENVHEEVITLSLPRLISKCPCLSALANSSFTNPFESCSQISEREAISDCKFAISIHSDMTSLWFCALVKNFKARSSQQNIPTSAVTSVAENACLDIVPVKGSRSTRAGTSL